MQGVPVRMDEALDEIDFGEWTGRSFEELEPDPRWQRWNAQRATGIAPGGEAMRDVQRRILHAVEALDTTEPVAFVSHGDVIKAAMVAFLGLSLDAVHTLSVEPGALVYVETGASDAQTVAIHGPYEDERPALTLAR
jgi:broad specificity phosphatase PhoE